MPTLSSRPYPSVLPLAVAVAFTDSRPSTAIRFHFREAASFLSSSLFFFPRAVALFLLPPVFLPVLFGEAGPPRLFPVMAQLFVYMGSKERFSRRMGNLSRRDRIAERYPRYAISR